MPDLIQPTPRSQLWGVPADLLKQAQEFGEAPFGYPNPPVKLLMELFGVPAIQRTMDKLSYGEPITNLGKANVPLLPSDTAEAALSVVPGLGAAATRVPKLAVAGAKNLAVPRLAAKGAAQRGAVTLGGIDDAVATHGSATLDQNIKSIEANGLYAPSIGLHRSSASAYTPAGPQLVFRAGALDRHFPDEAPSGIYNRDAYVWNSNRDSDKPIKDQWAAYRASDTVERRLSKLMGDARLTQMLPDQSSQSAAILASPNFKSLREWETSPYGYGALADEVGTPGSYTQRLAEYKTELARLISQNPRMEHSGEEFLTSIAKLGRANLDPELLRGSFLGDTFSLARGAPSQLGEYKIYAPSVPATPGEASIYMRYAPSAAQRDAFEGAGYDLYGPKHIAGLARDLGVEKAPRSAMPLHLLAPKTGQAPPSAAEALRMYEDLKVPKLWPGAKFAANPPQLPAVGGNSLNLAPKGLPADFDAKYSAWLASDSVPAELNLEKIFGVDSQSATQLVSEWLKSETPMKALLKKHFGAESVPAPAKIKPLAP